MLQVELPQLATYWGVCGISVKVVLVDVTPSPSCSLPVLFVSRH